MYCVNDICSESVIEITIEQSWSSFNHDWGTDNIGVIKLERDVKFTSKNTIVDFTPYMARSQNHI